MKIKQHKIKKENFNLSDREWFDKETLKQVSEQALEESDMEKHLNLIGEIVMPLLTLDAVDIEQFDKDNFELKELDEVFEKQHDVANDFFQIIACMGIAQTIIQEDDYAKKVFSKTFNTNFESFIQSNPKFLMKMLKRFKANGFNIGKEQLDEYMKYNQDKMEKRKNVN